MISRIETTIEDQEFGLRSTIAIDDCD